MEYKELIELTQQYIRKLLENEGSGHDWWHTYRVWKMAQLIANAEKDSNQLVVELSALLHDIADWKSNKGDENIGPQMAGDWMASHGLDKETIDKVKEVIKAITFRGAGNITKVITKEAMIVQDADRLDAIGAIGIARGFMFAGNKGLPMYDPDIKPLENMNADQYKDLSRKSYTQINHFYEKLLLLKDLMNTNTGKEVANGRHDFMREYLDRFYLEWEGKD